MGEVNDFRAFLETLSPSARDDLRRVLIRDQADRDAIFSPPMRIRMSHFTIPPVVRASGFEVCSLQGGGERVSRLDPGSDPSAR